MGVMSFFPIGLQSPMGEAVRLSVNAQRSIQEFWGAGVDFVFGF